MAETIVSPGVLAIENDQSFITQQPIQAGAAIIGPTPKGKVGIPVLCTTYSDYLNKFGSTFISGSQTYTYLTSISAYNYFNSGGNTLLVTRVVSGTFTPATSSIITETALTSASLSVNLTYISSSLASVGSQSLNINGITLFYTGSATLPTNTSTVIYIRTGSFAASAVADYVATSSAIFNFSSSIASYSASLQFISSSVFSATNLLLTSTASNGVVGNSYYAISGSTTSSFSGGTNTTSFTLETLSAGKIMNSSGPIGSNGSLLSGSLDNFRWQITNKNIQDGTFSLIIRQGNDNNLFPSIIETWSNLSLDPLSSNYIEKVIGNQIETLRSDNGEYYIQSTGSFINQSKYVRIKSVELPTPLYLDNNDTPKPIFTGSLPWLYSGSFGGAEGNNISNNIAGNYFENISNNNIQGLSPSAYTSSIYLLGNKDAYQYNLITAPGLIADETNYPTHVPIITDLLSMVQDRKDSMSVIDVVGYNSNINPVVSNALSYNTSYAATYWPWVKTIDPNTGNQVWVPPSTVIPGVYAFNDQVSAPWFAPAGINRGVLSNVIQAERYLTQGNRDLLYSNNINSIATFPNVGVVVFGQKTLQKKKSALDRVNVRRLLIELKNYISQISNTLVFEQNNVVTRNSFLSQVNPYLSSIQQQQGLTDFKVIMDESNNTSNTIDNNQLIGQIYLQPTKTVEFIILDFNILPTGAVFPS
jgi:hypothetical protein